MTLSEIAVRNLIRRKGKAALILIGLVIGVATVVSVVTFADTVTGDINDKLEKYGANILIVPKTENLSLSYGGISMGGISFDMKEIRESDLARVRTITNAANIAAVGPMVLGATRIQERPVMLAGVDFSESRVLKPWWKVSGRFPEDGELLPGAEAARHLGLEPGMTVNLDGRRFRISGLLEPTGSQDDQLVFTRLASAQALLGKIGRLSLAEVAALCTDCPITEMVRQLSAVLPGARVMAIQQVVKGRMETLHQFKRFSFGISVLVVLIGSLAVIVTMIGNVRERKQEIGVFRAIGFRKSHVMRIVMIEAGIISFAAGILGYLGGIGATRLALLLFTESAGAELAFRPELAAGSLVVAVAVGMASALYPAMLAARMDPNEALRAL
ncbi:MAG: ABC transporter permease [Desulfobacterales bacterium]|jgi:putative ABC transport system permease protein